MTKRISSRPLGQRLPPVVEAPARKSAVRPVVLPEGSYREAAVTALPLPAGSHSEVADFLCHEVSLRTGDYKLARHITKYLRSLGRLADSGTAVPLTNDPDNWSWLQRLSQTIDGTSAIERLDPVLRTTIKKWIAGLEVRFQIPSTELAQPTGPADEPPPAASLNAGVPLQNGLPVEPMSITEEQHQAAKRVPRPDREGKRLIAGHFDAETAEQLKDLARARRMTIQAVLEEAVQDLFQKHGKPVIALNKGMKDFEHQ